MMKAPDYILLHGGRSLGYDVGIRWDTKLLRDLAKRAWNRGRRRRRWQEL